MTYIPTIDIFVTIDGQPSHYDGTTVPATEVDSTITRLRRDLKHLNPLQAIWVGFQHNLPIAYWQNINGDYIKRDRLERSTIANVKYRDCDIAWLDNFFKSEDGYGLNGE